MCPASIEYSIARASPAGVMSSDCGSSAWIASPIARTVPELPTADSQPRCGTRPAPARAPGARRGARARCAWRRSCRRGRSARRATTQPICRLSSSSGVVALADDELGAAAADVDHQTLAGGVRHAVRDARVDEARLLHAGDDLDRVAERLARALEEDLLAVREAQRVGADDAHAVGVHVAQALPETLQARERARRHVLVDAAVLGDAGGEAHHLAQPVDDDQLAVRVARDDHVEAVGAQVHRREYVGDRAGCGAGGGGAVLGGAAGGRGTTRVRRPRK